MKHYFTFSLITKIGLLLILLSACSTPDEIQKRKCTKALKHFEKVSFQLGCPWNGLDSSVSQKTTIIVRDTTVYVTIQADTVTKTIFPLSGKRSVLHTKYATSEAWIQSDSLQHILTQLQSEIPKTITGAIKYETILKEKIIRVPYPTEKLVKKPLSVFLKILIWSGALAWGLAIAWVIYRFSMFFIFRARIG